MHWLAIAILILGLFGAAILRRHLRESKLLRLREIAHQERTMAMERGLAVPDSGAGRIDMLLLEGEGTDTLPDRVNPRSIHWVRLAALALGLTLLFGGAGIVPGIYLQTDPEIRGTWPFGLVPIFIGAGLLLFVRLSRGLAEKIRGEEDTP